MSNAIIVETESLVCNFFTVSDENAQLWKGGKGMLILIVWVSKFNESTFYIIKLLVIYNVQFVCSGWYIVFVIDFKIKVLVELFF